jgi:hypothetical protein
MESTKFEGLTPAEKRVAIAEDVLERLRTGRVKAAHGAYVRGAFGRMTEDIADAFDQVKTCKACAIGATFVAALAMGRGFLKSDMRSFYDQTISEMRPTDMKFYLSRYFNTDQLKAIECAFEGWIYEEDCHFHFEITHFNDGIDDPAERMARIMRNIVENDGLFAPENP